MTWAIYHQTLDALEGSEKRKFLTQAEDVEGLRKHDRAMLKEKTNKGTKGL